MLYAPATITEDNLIAVLSDARQRSDLQKAMSKEHGGHLPLTNRYYDLAQTCKATPEQLHEVVKAMLAFRGRYKRLVCGLVFNPNIAERTLLLLYEKRCCIDELGHRSAPQRLLECIAAKYRYDEAITTLALQYYSKPECSTDAFANFLNEHSDNGMLRINITHRLREFPLDKQEVIARLFITSDESTKT